MKKILAILVCALLVVACGDKASVSTAPSASAGIEGTYILENGKDTLIFTRAGEVTSKHPLFETKVTNYKVADSEITFQFPQGHPMKLTVIDETHLKSYVGGTFVKQ
ncbi:hypothetical protein [Comamonas testosteroni]|jgi:hypothetical protein|uniref:hypothetical protein n=1 Tax=Comamonas testosteroni TaxID=285 RepID=UPI0026F1690B|nr:hypothetical protein [Comamonas testosteroni]